MERNATSEQVEVALYDMLYTLQKQLQERVRATREIKATLRSQFEELHINLTETHFERERAIIRIKELG